MIFRFIHVRTSSEKGIVDSSAQLDHLVVVLRFFEKNGRCGDSSCCCWERKLTINLELNEEKFNLGQGI